jgi:metal-responsive CopG/Arc/MetJ family transcriptional regulator
MKKVLISLTEPELTALDTLKEEKGLAERSELVRRAIDEYLEKETSKKEKFNKRVK